MSKEPVGVNSIDLQRMFEYGDYTGVAFTPTQREHALQLQAACAEYLKAFQTGSTIKRRYELNSDHLLTSDLLVHFHLPNELEAPRESLGIMTSLMLRSSNNTVVMPNVLESLRDSNERVAYAAAGLCTSLAHRLVHKIHKRSHLAEDNRSALLGLSKGDFKGNVGAASLALNNLYGDYYGIPLPPLQGVVVNCLETIVTLDGEEAYTSGLFDGSGKPWARHCTFGWLGCDSDMNNEVTMFGSMKYSWARGCVDDVNREIKNRLDQITSRSAQSTQQGNIFNTGEISTQ